MLYRGSDLCDFHLNAKDGRVGKIKDIYFDDLSWTVRYLVVDTGSWLSGREVLIAPHVLTGFNDDAQAFLTNLSLQTVNDSPSPEAHRPVSRQYEERLNLHYGWESYWGHPIYPWANLYAYPLGVRPYVMPQDESVTAHAVGDHAEKQGDAHLRSRKEIHGYGIIATDGLIGEINDVLIEPGSWRITHLVADTRTWWPGKHVVIDRGMVRKINWFDRRVELDLTRAELRNSPEYRPGMTVVEEYQREISAYYSQLAARNDREIKFRRERHLEGPTA